MKKKLLLSAIAATTLMSAAGVSQAEEKHSEGHKLSEIADYEWFDRVTIGGDFRFRQEHISEEGQDVINKSRVRARLTVDAKITDDLDLGFRFATGSSAVSANQTLEGGFGSKGFFVDRAFIDWHPDFGQGAHLLIGKFAMPWKNINSNIWDADVNPEGLALKYDTELSGVKLKSTVGYYFLTDGVGTDVNMWNIGLNASTKFNDTFSGSLGFNTFQYSKDLLTFSDKGASLYEISGSLKVNTVVPVEVFANYVINANAVDKSQNEAMSIGVKSSYKDFNLGYDYRITENEGVVEAFNDSDFAKGRNSSRGHTLKGGYKFNDNFALGLTYMNAELDATKVVDHTVLADIKVSF